MRKIVTKSFVILSIILICISICSISTVDAVKSGTLPIKQTFIINDNMFHGIASVSVIFLPYKLIPLFYISLVLSFLSGILNFTKEHKFKSIATIIITCVPIVYVMITHNYVQFLILFNIWLFLYILLNYFYKDKLCIFAIAASIIICFVNIIKLVEHLRLDFTIPEIAAKVDTILINISKINLICLALWIIPYAILITKEILNKSIHYKNAHEKNVRTPEGLVSDNNIPNYHDSTDIKSKLEELKAMFEENLITDEEYDSKRKELLDRL